ncbi:MAG TPA: hypothetical protein VKH36_08785 [Acidimicrobiia bacterium]|nr:hypothetical protein [Acidimicrobiia bacterium]
MRRRQRGCERGGVQSGGTDHVLVVLDHHCQKKGKPEQDVTSHFWTVKDGRFSEFRELPDDKDQFTAGLVVRL